jgi:hypothetical protein
MVEAVERTRTTSNRTTIREFDAAHRHPQQPVERLVDGRLAASEAFLAYEPITVGGVKDYLRSHVGGEDGYTICMHVPELEVTRGSMIAELPIDGASRAWFLTGSPCTSEYDRFDL